MQDDLPGASSACDNVAECQNVLESYQAAETSGQKASLPYDASLLSIERVLPRLSVSIRGSPLTTSSGPTVHIKPSHSSDELC